MNRENANPFTELDERLRFETLLADLSSKFVNLPAGCRLDSNANAFLGGFRMWEPASSRAPQTPNGLVMTRQRKRKEHAHEENQLIADGTPAMEGARCPP